MDNQNVPYNPPASQAPVSYTTPSPAALSSPKKSSIPKRLLSLIVGFIILILAIYITYIATLAYTATALDKTYVVNGPSMSPTLVSGQKVLVAKYNVLNTKLLNTSVSINDIVLFNETINGQHMQLIKRVVALSGDRVVISNGKLTVYDTSNTNGFDPSTAYEPASSTTPGNIDIVVPAGDVYVLGDNRGDSLDSEEFGPVPITSIIGKEIGVLS
jgi:signal peptidase I